VPRLATPKWGIFCNADLICCSAGPGTLISRWRPRSILPDRWRPRASCSFPKMGRRGVLRSKRNIALAGAAQGIARNCYACQITRRNSDPFRKALDIGETIGRNRNLESNLLCGHGAKMQRFISQLEFLPLETIICPFSDWLSFAALLSQIKARPSGMG